MTEQEIIQAIQETTFGANIWVQWERPVKLKKEYKGMPLTKKTKMLCRIGVQYDNIKQVKLGRMTGELPPKNAGLKGFVWTQYPILLKSRKTGEIYIRLESGTFSAKTNVQFLLDGQEVKKEDWEHTMLSSEKKTKKEGHKTFNCKISTIQRLHETVQNWDQQNWELEKA